MAPQHEITNQIIIHNIYTTYNLCIINNYFSDSINKSKDITTLEITVKTSKFVSENLTTLASIPENTELTTPRPTLQVIR